MAKIVIDLEAAPRGLSVGCSIEPAEKDTKLIQHLAAVIAAGLAGHVNEKIRKAINDKEANNVH
ncbi:hypothetical protein [Pantoea stewartii]|uniref:hypothetical protein n=1 Tax=Pantoea TaxID=53335 RepID=UPI0033662C2D